MQINLRDTPVFGYESPACLEMLVSLMIGMIEGDAIPPVRLDTFDDGSTFEIPYTAPFIPNYDGGHHRVLAAYLLGHTLEVEIAERINGQMRIQIPPEKRLHMGQIKIELNPKNFVYEKYAMRKYYRDLPSVSEFFSKYGKLNLALKYGTYADFSFTPESYQRMLDGIDFEMQKLVPVPESFKGT